MERMLFLSDEKGFYLTEFGHSVVNEPTFRGPWARNIYILHFVVKGTCHFCEFDARAGEAFLIARGEYHSFSIDGDYEHFWFGFSGDGADKLLRVFGLVPQHHLRLRAASFSEIKERLYVGFERCRGLSTTEAERYACGLLLSFLPLLSEEKDGGKEGYDLTAAKKYLEENYPHPVTVSDLAAKLHVSEKHFAKRFKTAFGVAPKRYLTTVRLQNACELLKETDMKVKDIAVSVGFASQLVFCDFFKTGMGLSPTEYRKRERGTS